MYITGYSPLMPAAARRYLVEHPDGAYHADVRRYFDRAEPRPWRRVPKDLALDDPTWLQRQSAGYRRYLELSPQAPDAAFIRSIVR